VKCKAFSSPIYSLSDFENPQKSQGPQDADPKGHAGPEEAPNHLDDAADDDLKNMAATTRKQCSFNLMNSRLAKLFFLFFVNDNVGFNNF